GKPWCGGSFGLTRDGRLLDPRLQLCDRTKDRLVAFAWIDPLPEAKWIVVRDGSTSEIYPVAGSLPVRVSTTSDVFRERSLAVFHVAQYGADGTRLRSASVEA